MNQQMLEERRVEGGRDGKERKTHLKLIPRLRLSTPGEKGGREGIRKEKKDIKPYLKLHPCVGPTITLVHYGLLKSSPLSLPSSLPPSLRTWKSFPHAGSMIAFVHQGSSLLMRNGRGRKERREGGREGRRDKRT